MDLPYNIIKGGTVSVVALTLTYPLDIWKINSQSAIKSSLNIKSFINGSIYRGFVKSALLTFPEKGIKLGIYKYIKNKQEDSTKFYAPAAIISAACQSNFSAPIDNIKISNLYKKPIVSYFSGLKFIYARDILFNLTFFYNADNKTFTNNTPINNLLSGSIATSLVTPIDFIKTRYQEHFLNNTNNTNNLKFNFKKFIKETPVSSYYKGIFQRNMSISIFYSISYTLFNYF